MLRLCTVQSVEEKILAAARFKLNVDSKVCSMHEAFLFDNVFCLQLYVCLRSCSHFVVVVLMCNVSC